MTSVTARIGLSMATAFDVPQELFPVRHRFLDLDGARIHYVDEGTGDTLLLLHGNPSWSFLYRKIIGNTFAWPLDRDRRVRLFSWVMGGPVGRSLTRAFNFVPRFFFARGLAGRPSPQVLEMYLAPWRDPARRAAAVIAPRQLVAASSYLREVERNLPKLADRPTLIVWGLKDFAFQEAARRRFEQIFVKHRTVLIEDASHFLQEDAGDEIADSIRAFWKEVS
jgi:haloalkane dehalogenase